MSKVRGIYVKFYNDHSLNMVMSRDPGCKFRKFLIFLPNSILNFMKSYQIWGSWLKNKKVTGRNQNSGWKTPPTAYRVKVEEQNWACEDVILQRHVNFYSIGTLV